MHRKLIGSILYKQSCTAEKLAIKRAMLKYVFKRPVHIAFFKDDQNAVHMISLFVCLKFGLDYLVEGVREGLPMK